MPSRTTPLVIAHRGASGYRPEHTAAAYELALSMGADAVEPDIVATRDGVLVIRHENEISLTTDVESHPEFLARRRSKHVDGRELTGWFTEDFTWDELSTLRAKERVPATRPDNAKYDGKQPILRLRDLFDLVDKAKHKPGVVVEIKHATYFEAIGLPLDELLATELKAAGWDDKPKRLTIESFEKTVLAQMKGRDIAGRRIYLAEAKGRPFDLRVALGTAAPRYADQLETAGLEKLAAEGIDGVSVAKSLLFDLGRNGKVKGTTDLVTRAHKVGLQVFTWTLRPENRFLAKTFRRGARRLEEFGHWKREFRTVMGTGVDGVFADHPDLAVQIRESL
jgi:glycerophosphoryl diester phosphodiesterase